MWFFKPDIMVAGKAVVNMPVGGPAVMNNYMIAQPPGFQLATFVNIFLVFWHYCLTPSGLKNKSLPVPAPSSFYIYTHVKNLQSCLMHSYYTSIFSGVRY